MMAKSTLARLEELDRHDQPPACTTCWWWAATPVLVDDDGTYSRPLACPNCGHEHLTPYAIHIVGVPVGTP